MEDVKYHILYWEGESPHGIFLETERELTAQSRKRDGPGRCFCCGHVADSWRHRMDNMQISLRLCEDPNGKHFRQDVDGFHLLSPKMGISYHLSDFGNYLWSMDEKCPTENHIIGTALKVLKKEVLPTTCGVKVSTWNTAEGWQRWLEDKVCELRTGAEQRGGVSVGLILDKDGFEVGSCGISHPYFAHATEKPIREILVALGGPGGIDDAVMKVLEQRGDGHGLHLGLMRVKLPGGLHHSCVALNDLLQFHDKGYLYPIMEDNRFLRNSYQKWRTHLSRAVSAWAEPGSSAEEKTEALRHFIRNFQSQQTAKHAKNGDAWKGFTWPQVVAAPATYVATVRDAENYVSRLQAHGTLPSGKWPFRLRGCLESIEPGKAIDILRVVQLKKVEALCKGYDYDPWHELCEDLDAAIAAAALAPRPAPPRAPAPTPKDVQTLLVQCWEGLERFETKEDEGRPPGATQLELGALNRLSCRDAMLMLNRLRAQKPHVLQKRPADARSTAGLAQHAAMFHALRSGRSGMQLHSALLGMLERKGQRQKRTRASGSRQKTRASIGNSSEAERKTTASIGNSSEAPKKTTARIGHSSGAERKTTAGIGNSSEAPKKTTARIGHSSGAEQKTTASIGHSREAPKKTTAGIGRSREPSQKRRATVGHSSGAEQKTTASIGHSREAPKKTTGGIGHSREAPKKTTAGIGHSREVPKKTTARIGHSSGAERKTTASIGHNREVGAGAGAAVGTATGRMTATTIRCR
ncbi:unnamed protein product [Cladocopium goreaui]|uniref:Uncharacterized protein n=1 Tax=Cladocopium goreaui TaxID=2562237 RepID=A0A9P1GGK2_9DINO|nr:unnamed protein product [Cladocopium goreaui]